LKGVTVVLELIRISDQKVKIMLTATDMCHFELNNDHFFENGQAMQQNFRRLLDEIKKQIDFDTDDRHISVQYFPSREGGCEMFISCLAPKEDSLFGVPAKAEFRALELKKKPSGAGNFRRDCAYRFDTLDALLLACRRLRDVGYIGDSEAYLDKYDRYFLCISVSSSSPFSLPEEWSFITEYGTVENAAMLKLYIKEHGTVLCSAAAVHRLAELA